MKMQNYEKPVLKFVSLRNEEKVAKTCWGYHGTGTNLYYNIDGEGYVSFQIAGGSCTLNLTNVVYYTGPNDTTGTPVVDDPNRSDDMYDELYNALKASGGENGNNFSGEGTIVMPGAPDSSWS